ncbi:MAG: AsmA family protein [Acidobacteriaceae bacterium]|nr:AsmA family protein [Acidobacteriaceae bacterium]
MSISFQAQRVCAISETKQIPTRTKFRKLVRVLLIALLALSLCGLVAPWVEASRFSGRIKGALESSLGRKVEFEKAYFTVFSGPGFLLENVTISEDPHYGLEPFAYVPILQARLRLDKLLVGQIRFSSLRLVDPSLNLVKLGDGTWNVLALVQRLSAPRRMPLSFFPSFAVSDGRVNFKLGTHKSTLYISESDLSIYPQRSGKVFFRFSGSPARTDRAGMGFGHFRGDVNWFLNSSRIQPNQLEAHVYLDPSNLSELTTLVQGHDVGVHGTLSSQLHIQGPLNALQVTGDLHLDDVHRWDLLSAPGENWIVRYAGDLDLLKRRLELKTVPSAQGQIAPVALHLRVNDFLTRANSSVLAELNAVPIQDLLPLARRMGLSLPNDADLRGSLNGAIGYTSGTGWAGGFTITNAEAALPGAPVMRTAAASVTVVGDHAHFDPAIIEAGGGGTLKLGGDYFFLQPRANATLSAVDVPIKEVKSFATAWFGEVEALSALRDGDITGRFSYTNSLDDLSSSGNHVPSGWSGQFELSDATVAVQGFGTPLEHARGMASFGASNFELNHLTATLGRRTVYLAYRYNLLARRPEHLRVQFPMADLSELQAIFASDKRNTGLWARLGFLRRSLGVAPLPTWLTTRNIEGDLVVDRLSAEGQPLGALNSHFIWQGASLQLTELALNLMQGRIRAHGTVDLGSYVPRWQFSASASDYPWSGGLLSAEGKFSSVGAGKDLLRNLIGEGSFAGQGLALSTDDNFENVSGLFRFSFNDGWPDLRLTNIQAAQNGDRWTGEGATQSDGKLLVDLTREGRQLHFVGSLAGESVSAPLSGLPRPVPNLRDPNLRAKILK